MEFVKKLLLLFSLFVLSNSMSAQLKDTMTTHISTESKYEAETIYLTFTGFVKNGKGDDMGITGGKLKREMMISPDALMVFKKFQRQRNWLYLLSGLELATSIAALTTKNKSLKTGMLVSGAAFSVVSIPLYIGSVNNENKAVWLRNRDVLK